jgi:hypothetical protein
MRYSFGARLDFNSAYKTARNPPTQARFHGRRQLQNAHRLRAQIGEAALVSSLEGVSKFSAG